MPSGTASGPVLVPGETWWEIAMCFSFLTISSIFLRPWGCTLRNARTYSRHCVHMWVPLCLCTYMNGTCRHLFAHMKMVAIICMFLSCV